MNNLYGTPRQSNHRWDFKDSLSVCRKPTGISGCAKGIKADNGGGWYKRVWFNGRMGSGFHCGRNQSCISTSNCSKGWRSKKLSNCNCGGSSHCGGEQYSSNKSAYYGDKEEYSSSRNNDNFGYDKEAKFGNEYQTNAPVTTYTPTVIAHAPQEAAAVPQVAAPVQTITASTPQVTTYAQPVASYAQPASLHTAAMTAYSPKQMYQIDDRSQLSYCNAMALACVVMAFLNPLFGIIALCLAYCGLQNQMTSNGRRFMNYSVISSIIGIISTSLIVITIIILLRYGIITF